MPFNVANFKAAVSEKNIMRPNLFLAQFMVPPGLLGQANRQTTVRELEFWVESTNLPSLGLVTYQGNRHGYGTPELRPVFTLPNQEINFDIIFDAEATNWNFFYDWMNLICANDARNGPFPAQPDANGNSPYELSYRDQYMTDTSILIFDQTNPTPRIKLVLRESYPKGIGDIRLSWIERNTYMRLPIQLAYTDYYRENVPLPAGA